LTLTAEHDDALTWIFTETDDVLTEHADVLTWIIKTDDELTLTAEHD